MRAGSVRRSPEGVTIVNYFSLQLLNGLVPNIIGHSLLGLWGLRLMHF